MGFADKLAITALDGSGGGAHPNENTVRQVNNIFIIDKDMDFEKIAQMIEKLSDNTKGKINILGLGDEDYR